MRQKVNLAVGGLISVFVVLATAVSLQAAAKQPVVGLSGYSTMRETLASVKLPAIEQPDWLAKQLAAEASAASAGARRAPGAGAAVTYSVTTRGAVYANLAEFKQQANQTLNDARGWSRMNVNFQEVPIGGRFTLVLAEAGQLPTFSSGCSSLYSCRAGNFVIINQDRWMGATPSWNGAGGSLRDYRHMVVNHEVGHWLGHGHQNCGGSGQSAPVMQQQSIDLQGCSFNPWPLASELRSGQLGI